MTLAISASGAFPPSSPWLSSSPSPSSPDAPASRSPLRAPDRESSSHSSSTASGAALPGTAPRPPVDAALGLPAPPGHAGSRARADRARGHARADNGLRPSFPAPPHAPPRSPTSCCGHGAGSTSMRTRLQRGARSATRRGSSCVRTGSRRSDRFGAGHAASAALDRPSPRWRRSDAARPGTASSRRGSSTRSSARWSASGRRSSSCCSACSADGHVLLEDYPGLAKTLTARSFAQVTQTALRARSSSRPT